MSERTRGKSNARLNAAVLSQRARGKLPVAVIKSEGDSSDSTQENSNADMNTEGESFDETQDFHGIRYQPLKKAAAIKKNSGQSFLKLNKWTLMFPAILFKQLLCLWVNY